MRLSLADAEAGLSSAPVVAILFDASSPDAPPIRELLAHELGEAASVELAIDAADDMLVAGEDVLGHRPAALFAYFRDGLQIRDALWQVAAWRFGSLAGAASVLDFACG